MAQAARLNLRMQKELKLLLTEPPPGASFPFLSADSELSSLSTIHAQIEGPEGTVYAKGIFDINIQVPERYPFQPPSVTLVTPIYHPNIDNGGRICLDILNLPPKGAWQPSLNISTVLTSIGLLLSEPNPDDGLMCEASREYKYNRQAFDQKARSMTERYAKGGAGGNNCITQCVQTNLNSGVTEFGESEESKLQVTGFVSSHNKPSGISQKLSLELSSSSQNREDSDVEVNEMEAKGKRKEVNITFDEWNLRREKLYGTRRKLSLESSCQIQKMDGQNVLSNQSSIPSPQTVSASSSGSSVLQPSNFSQQKLHHHKDSELKDGCINISLKQLCQFNQKRPSRSLGTFQLSDDNNEKMLIGPLVLSSQSHPNASCVAPSMPLSVNGNGLEPRKNLIDRTGNDSADVKCKEIPSFGKKLSLGFKGSSQVQQKENKENVAPIQKPPFSGAQSSSTSGIRRKLSLGPLTKLQGSNDIVSQLLPHYKSASTDASMSLPLRKHHGCNNKEQCDQNDDTKVAGETEQHKTVESPTSEAVVVLDSEDSEEEDDVILRSKLLIARRRTGKCRAKA